jgi:ZIP family zinc transporter
MNVMESILLALTSTAIPFLCTIVGAGAVFFFKNEIPQGAQRVFLGFAAGVMIAASVWSLLIPAIDMGKEQGGTGLIPAAGGFIIGVAFLWLLDVLMPHLHPNSNEPEGVKSSLRRTTLLVLAVTLHNIPEGMAVGLAASVAQFGETTVITASSAIALSIGIGLQNLPEGAAVSLPLRREGVSRGKAFMLGTLSGVVEPLGAIAAILLSGGIIALMPWMLAFAAGAMLYVVVEELIPEAHLGEHSNVGTMGVLAGFLVMMVLDVALG